MENLIPVICVVGIICSLITISLNINLVVKVVLKKSKRKEDMKLFYYRFALDILFGFCLLVFIAYVIVSLEFPDVMAHHRYLTIYLGLPWSNLAACRSIIALSISTERFIAAYFPISYRTGKVTFPAGIILVVSIGFGLSEQLVLFGFCAYDFVIAPSCQAFGCSVNKCFYSFWTIHKAIIFFIIAVLSILLSLRLFLWKSKNQVKTNSDVSKANRLALLGTVTVLIFDVLPSFLSMLGPTAEMFNFEFVGPYNAVGKVTGCAIESVIASNYLVFQKSKISDKTSSTAQLSRFWKSSSSKHVITF